MRKRILWKSQISWDWIACQIRSRPLTLFFCAIYLASLVQIAWVCDDAYITMRTVDNWVNGYGLTWNVAERVQAYSHPLWMLLLSLVYAIARQAYPTLIGLSFAFAIAAVSWAAFKALRDDYQAGFALALACASMAFGEYSTSGLENPLSFWLLSLLAGFYLQEDFQPGVKQSFWLACLAALAALTRLDLILFFTPALLGCTLPWNKSGRGQVWAALCAGFSPLLVWELFSLFYYGSLVPNPAYAKLNTGISQLQLLAQGGLYFLDILRWDPLTLLVALAGAGAALWKGPWRARALGIGLVLYLGFIAWVGGDFMRGRFFAAPFWLGAILMARTFSPRSVRLRWALLAGVSVFGIASAFVRPILKQNEPVISVTGIADERGFYLSATGLIVVDHSRTVPDHPWVYEGLSLRDNKVEISPEFTIGFRGFFAGPQVHIVDRLALAEPLLARLPVSDPLEWRIGHFYREFPQGYLETLSSGENRLADPALAQYYEHLRLVTRGDLLDPERLKTILKMNLGIYDDLLDQYLARQISP